MKKFVRYLMIAMVCSSCKFQHSEAPPANATKPEERLEIESVQMERVEGSQFKLVTPDLNAIETWEAPIVSVFPMPTPDKDVFELGVNWAAPDLVKTYSQVALCHAEECIVETTVGHQTSFPGYPRSWEGKSATVKVRLCADDESKQPRCTPEGTTSLDLTKFPLAPQSADKLQIFVKRQQAIQYSKQFYDILAEYKTLSASISDSDLTLSHQATDNALAAGRMTLAVSVSRYRDILLSDIRSILPSQTGYSLTASNHNDKWLYVSDYDSFDSARKDKFDYAMAHPSQCGHMRWKTEEGPLVDKYNEEYNKLRMIECVDTVPPKGERDRIAAEEAHEKRVKTSTSYVTGSLVLGAGLIVGFISLYAYSPIFRMIVGIDRIAKGDYWGGFDVVNSQSPAWIKGRTALIGGGMAVGLAVIGISLMAHAEESIRLAQKPRNAPNDFLESEIRKFFDGLRNHLF